MSLNTIIDMAATITALSDELRAERADRQAERDEMTDIIRQLTSQLPINQEEPSSTSEQ